MRRLSRFFGVFTLALVLASGCATPQEVAEVVERPEPPVVQPDTLPEPVSPEPEPVLGPEPGRFDTGKMWTFDNPPVDYFQEAYDFQPDSAWFAKARLGALRFSTFCSASFVSPTGLVMTNHHCARESVTEVSQPGEDLIDNGFYAPSLDEERKVPELYVEQLIDMQDVTERVQSAARSVRGDDEKAQAIRNRIEQLETQLTAEAKQRDTTMTVQVIDLYDGGQYAAYTFRRYNDVRLVMAPEERLGYFGGDADNFTYPRYALDVSFFRVFGPDDQPLTTEHFFPWSTTGSREGDAVFVVGNPGTTNRLSTVSELVFERDYTLPEQLDVLEAFSSIYVDYLSTHGEGEDAEAAENTLFSINNSIKSTRGELEGLRDMKLLERRAAAEAAFRADLSASDSLRRAYGTVFQDLAELQQSKEAVATRQRAFTYFGTELGSHVLLRALYGWYVDMLKRRGLPSADLADIREEALAVEDLPAALEQELIAYRLRRLQNVLGASDPTVRAILGGQSPDSIAARIVANTVLLDSARFAVLLGSGYLNSGDPTVRVIDALAPLYFQFAQQQQSFENRQEILSARLARARFDLYGTTIPPDASFSLRIADGVVKGYPYNGTRAPAYTTFYGLYNHNYSHPSEDWQLPERWLSPPATFDLSTPLNLVTTADITGGNSGSPLLNKDLEVVGLIFDGNIESLPNTYLYTDTRARAIAVDARGILEALDDIYDADRIVLELTTGRLTTSEAEADEAAGSR